MIRRRERWLAALLTAIATAAFFVEYLPGVERVHLFSDIEIYHYPLARYAFDALKAGRIPQWDPSMYCGIPFAGNIQAALLYPPSWLLFAASWTRDFLPFQALQCFAFAHVGLAFLLCYLWLRRKSLEALPSALGAAVYAFGGYMMWQIVHLGVVTAMAWMPLALGGIDDAVTRCDWRPLWKTALASALWCLAGYPPSWAAFCITIVLYGLVSEGRWRAAIGAAGAIAGSMLLAAAQILPAVEASTTMFRQTRYTSETKPIIVPMLVANWRDFGRLSPLSYLDCMYVYLGVAAVFAIGWALWRGEFRPYRQPAIVLASCLFLVFDPGHVVYYTIVRIPGLDRALQSYNFLEGATAMAALVTATGIGEFLRSNGRAPGRWQLPLCVLAMAAWSARQLLVWSKGGAFSSGWGAVGETAAAVAIFAAALGTMRGESGARRAALAAVVLLFVFADYKVFGTNRHFNTRDGAVPQAATTPPGINEGEHRTMRENRHFRVTSDGSPSSMDFRMWALASPQGLDPLLPDQYRRLIGKWGAEFQTTRVFRMDYANDEMLQTLAVRYVISYKASPIEAVAAGSPRFRRIGAVESFYRVYEYVDAHPPYEWAGEASPTEWLPERRVFRASSAAGGRFGLVEQFYPGWRATVDGRPADIERWRGAFQSIAVPAGEHTIAFEYRSRLLRLGSAISLVSLVLLSWVACASSVSQRRHSQK